jgi:hypothetical protein
MVANEDDATVNVDHNISADNTDISTPKGQSIKRM